MSYDGAVNAVPGKVSPSSLIAPVIGGFGRTVDDLKLLL